MRKLNKALLLELAEEFDTNVTQTNAVREIRLAITESADYDAVAARESVARILAERERLEKNS